MPQLTGLPLARRVDTKPSHTIHLTGTVSGLCEQSFEGPLSLQANSLFGSRTRFILGASSERRSKRAARGLGRGEK